MEGRVPLWLRVASVSAGTRLNCVTLQQGEGFLRGLWSPNNSVLPLYQQAHV